MKLQNSKNWFSDLLVGIYFGLGSFVLVFLILFIATLFQSANPFDKNYYDVEIPAGITTYGVAGVLEEKGILKEGSSFTMVARLLGLSKNIKAGKYSFSPSENMFSVLGKLKAGKVIETKLESVKVTFPEGTSIYKMGVFLQKEGYLRWQSFQQLTHEGVTADLRNRHWGLFKYMPTTESLEGYLYPDTYLFFKEAPVTDLVEVMVGRFEEMVLPIWEQRPKNTKYTLHEILTLASIIEKEAQKPSERPIIASVFYNRLNKGMPLAADPTIKYALERPSKKVYHDQLEIDSPYNTYKRIGLPPGPICNPGIESIKAALYPAKTNYYFFVAAKDGSHIFTRTFAEHQKARLKTSQ